MYKQQNTISFIGERLSVLLPSLEGTLFHYDSIILLFAKNVNTLHNIAGGLAAGEPPVLRRLRRSKKNSLNINLFFADSARSTTGESLSSRRLRKERHESSFFKTIK
jgi:hypothetical protein